MTDHRKCLFPTDFGALAESAAPIAAEYVRALGGTLHVVHVVQPMVPTAPGNPMFSHAEANPVLDIEGARAALEAFASRGFGELTPAAHTALLTGSPAHAVAEYAAKHAIDLLIVPTRADGILKRMLLGSVSKCLLESSSCPVLMIPSAAIETGES